jgi:cephalosporin hydroxylase
MEQALDLPLREVLKRMQDAIMTQTTYFGVTALKNPGDAWVYQEIMFERRPDVVIEFGVNHGGGALRLAHSCDLLQHGRVIGIDISLDKVPELVRSHPRITLLEMDALAAFAEVRARVLPGERVLAIEDSSHTYDNTLGVLRAYEDLLQVGDYFIVEDSICWHGLEVGPRPGPFEAIGQFVSENRNFAIDRSREKFFITWNPKGFLVKVN